MRQSGKLMLASGNSKSFARAAKRYETNQSNQNSQLMHLSRIDERLCAFCHGELGSKCENLGGVVNANQIIKLFSFYESHPSGLLLLLASTDAEQRFFEMVYN